MAAKLIVRKESGEELFDTTKISYGFVKSGYMFYSERWMRYIKPFTNTDPDVGSSWTPGNIGDNVYGFSVTDAKSPIIFIVGTGTLTGTSVSGNVTTFLYTNASTDTKCYVFDLMSDNIAGGPYLKTYNEDGEITFNSLQLPLDIVTSVTPPNVGAAFTDGWGGFTNCYVGGWFQLYSDQYAPQAAGWWNGIHIPLEAGVEYASYLPWTRAALCQYVFDMAGPTFFGVVEGSYGRVGGISFMFGPSGATQNGRFTFGTGYTGGTRWKNVPTDRLPTALVIKTQNYPFPYG